MKIALVLDDTLDTPDGVQQYVLTIGAWLATQGHEVHYLVGQTIRSDIPNVHVMSRNIHVKFNGNRMSMPLPVSNRRLRTFLTEQQFDVIHVQVPYSPFMAGRLVKSAPRRTAIVGTFHILPYSRLVTFANHLLAAANRRSGKRFDRMLAVSAPARLFARSIYGYEAEVLPNPVQLAQFRGIESGNPDTNIVFLGRLVERKGSLQLLQAVAYLKEEQLYRGDFRVYIGGKGELQPVLTAFIHDHGLEDVVALQGFVEEADKAAFLAQADIAVYPSLAGESFGIVLLEGMAVARGVVLGGNNPGYAAVLEPYAGQLFDPRDTRAFAELLAWQLDHPEARARAAELQRGYVEHFDVAVVGSHLVSIYTHLLQTKA
jgi:phosphatidyl-myo-inositol alpha-mannosyltransferase